MKKLLSIALILALFLETSQAFAAKVSKANGGARTADVSISSGLTITGVMIVCGGTACVSSIADTATLGGMSNGNTAWEGGAAANTSAFFDFGTAPIVTSTGASLNLDNTTTAVVIYTQEVAP